MSALHIAFNADDTPNVEVILKYMAESGEHSSFNFRNILHEMLGYHNFYNYLDSSTIQTTFMKEKTVYSNVVKASKKTFLYSLWYPEPRLDEQVIYVAQSPTLLINREFFTIDMREER